MTAPAWTTHPTVELDGRTYGARDSLFTAWVDVETGEQVTDFAVSDRLDLAFVLTVLKAGE
jgi:hypothetical protein